jgi:hypothetical protein
MWVFDGGGICGRKFVTLLHEFAGYFETAASIDSAGEFAGYI